MIGNAALRAEKISAMSVPSGEPSAYDLLPQIVEDAVRRGWSIFPCNIRKKPVVSKWKPFQKTAPGLDQVRAWASEYDPPAWATVTGAVSGIVVEDFDGASGLETMKRFGVQPHVKTGSGGYHHYLQHPGFHVPTLNGKTALELGKLYPGLDIRADGGYAVFFGHNLYGEYVHLRGLEPDPCTEGDIERLQAIAALSSSGRGAKKNQIEPIGTARVGASRLVERALRLSGDGRNKAGFWLACQLRDNRYSEAEAATIMRQFRDGVGPTDQKDRDEPYTESEAQASLEEAYSRPPREPWGKLPAIYVGTRQMRDTTAECLNALIGANDPPRVFARGASMVQVVQTAEGRSIIRNLSVAGARGLLGRSANYYRYGDGGPEPVAPPADNVQDLLALPPVEWSLPPLDGVIETPVLRPDGTLVNEPGYDASTRLFYAQPGELRDLRVSASPSSNEVEDAKALIGELLHDFPFDDECASKANLIAGIITPIVRPTISGPTPLLLIDSPAAGSGKTLLGEVTALIATGRPGSLFSAPGLAEEWRKALTSVLLQGAPVIIIDNISSRLESADLCRALTAETYSDRLLGGNSIAELRVLSTWIGTGNNIQVSGDMPRRCYWCRIDAMTPEPFKRIGFRHPKLKLWVTQYRRELLAALLVMARAWFAAGQPVASSPPMGSFEEWVRVVGGILSYVGINGFLENADTMQSTSDVETTQWETFLLALRTVFGGKDGEEAVPARAFFVADVVEKLNAIRPAPTQHASLLRQALPDVLARGLDRAGSLQHSLGRAFANRVGRRYGESSIYLQRAGIKHSAMLWAVLLPGEDPPNVEQETE
jgi:hypothetical protein